MYIFCTARLDLSDLQKENVKKRSFAQNIAN